MDQKKIDRINALARKVKNGETLTKDELSERDVLRREYIDSFKKNITAHLDNMYIVDEQGNKQKLQPKNMNQ